jgi:hypothetical protein
VNWDKKLAEDARLVILAELARQQDGQLNVLSIARVVDAMGITRSREWVETQLSFLEQLDAVRVQSVDLPGLGPVSVARLTRSGRDHVERRSRRAGVSPPADPE